MKIKQIELLKFGSLTTDNEEKESNAKSLTGYFLYPTTIEFQQKKDKLKGIKGLKFGIEYYLTGYTADKYDEAIFVCKIIHPPITNPKTKKTKTETVETKDNYLNQTNFDYFHFEYDWEIQKGIWTFQIIENNIIKLEKSFEII